MAINELMSENPYGSPHQNPINTFRISSCHLPDGAFEYPPLGANTSTWETHRMATALMKIGQPAEVVSYIAPVGTYDYPIFWINDRPAQNLYLDKIKFGYQLFDKLSDFVKKRKYDILHFHSNIPALFALAGLKERIPAVVTWGDPYLASLDDSQGILHLFFGRPGNQFPVGIVSTLLSLGTFARIDKVIAVSYSQKQRITSVMKVPSYKVEVVPPGVDTDVFTPCLPTQNLRIKLSIPLSTKVIMCPARITRLKNQLDLIEAMPDISKAYPSIQLLLVGAITDVNYFRILSKKAKELSLGNRVIFTGAVSADDFPRCYNLADVVVLPSLAEGLASSLLEAMSCAKPIVASDIAPNREAAVRGNEMIFFPLGNPSALCDAIISLIDDPVKRQEMAQAGRATALQNYSWARVAQLTVEAYSRAMS